MTATNYAQLLEHQGCLLTREWKDFIRGNASVLSREDITDNGFRLFAAILWKFNDPERITPELFLPLRDLIGLSGLTKSATSRALSNLVAAGVIDRTLKISSEKDKFTSINVVSVPDQWCNASVADAFVLPLRALKDKRLQSSSLRVLAAVGSFWNWTDNEDGVKASNSRLEALTGLSPRTVKRCLKSLVETGYLKREVGISRFQPSCYVLSSPVEEDE